MDTATGVGQVNAVAASTAANVWHFAGDFLAIIVLFTILFLLAWYVGRATLVSLLIAFYAAFAIYVTFPYMSLIASGPAADNLFINIGVYLLLTLLMYVILRRVVVSDFLSIGMLGTAILSFLGATFLISIGYHIFPVNALYDFSSAIDTMFSQKQFFFWWFSGPAIGLFFLAR